MKTFSSLFEKTRKLETFAELEKHGFDVKAIVTWVNESIIERQALLQDNSKNVISQLGEVFGQKRKIEEEIVEMDEKVKELEEKRAVAVSERWIKDCKIEMLQSSLDMTEE